MKTRIAYSLNEIIKLLFRRKELKIATKKAANDLIGPPNTLTNLRPIKYAIKENESKLEHLLRMKREELQLWNEEFWSCHNRRFFKEKEEYIKSELKKRNNVESLTADEMSVFYKDFLDKNWRNHFNYNFNWYKRNFYVTALDFRLRCQKLFS